MEALLSCCTVDAQTDTRGLLARGAPSLPAAGSRRIAVLHAVHSNWAGSGTPESASHRPEQQVDLTSSLRPHSPGQGQSAHTCRTSQPPPLQMPKTAQTAEEMREAAPRGQEQSPYQSAPRGQPWLVYRAAQPAGLTENQHAVLRDIVHRALEASKHASMKATLADQECAAQAQKLREKMEALKRAQHNAGHDATCNKLRQHMEKTEIALAKCQHRRIATQAQVLNFKKDVKSVEFLAKDISASQL